MAITDETKKAAALDLCLLHRFGLSTKDGKITVLDSEGRSIVSDRQDVVSAVSEAVERVQTAIVVETNSLLLTAVDIIQFGLYIPWPIFKEGKSGKSLDTTTEIVEWTVIKPKTRQQVAGPFTSLKEAIFECARLSSTGV